MDYLFQPAALLPLLDVSEWSGPEAVEIFKQIRAAWLGEDLSLESIK